MNIYEKRLKHISIINSNMKELNSYKNYSYRILLSIDDILINNQKGDIKNIYEQYLEKLKNNREFDVCCRWL